MDTTTETKMKTKTIELFQTAGVDATLRAAIAEFLEGNPGTTVASAAFSYAYPGRPGEGRWVGIDITYEVAQ